MSTSAPSPPRPIVIVTGANQGVGYGICQRLLSQLCLVEPSDAEAQPFVPEPTLRQFQDSKNVENTAGYDGLLLIMACRNMKRAEAARTKLLTWFDGYVANLKAKPGYDGHAERFKSGCEVQIQELDLACMSSVLKAGAALRKRLPYVSQIVFNAGVASFDRIDWVACFKQLFASPIEAVTAPAYYSQHSGEISADNLGWIWQSNVFGHFALFRELEPLLAKSPFDSARVIWSSSLEASPSFYDSEDWQLRKTAHSYESAKYQIDIIAHTLDKRAQHAARSSSNKKGGTVIRHFVSEPGVVSTTMSDPLVGPFMNSLKVIVFYLARWYGSPHHTITPFNAGVAACHLMLAPLLFIPVFANISSGSSDSVPVRFGAETYRNGTAKVGLSPVKKWEEHADEGAALVVKCDQLLDEFRKEAAAPLEFETASERM